MRVLFWGTSHFAVPSLVALLGEGYEVVGVVTQPDRPVGRSRSTLAPSPVKLAALAEDSPELSYRLPVLQPERPRGEEFLAQLRALEPDLSVVASYGHILVDEVIALPRLGTINVHASLLPALRGASPIRAAILEGRAETGVTIMRMVRELDAGPIILQAATPVLEDETHDELELRLSELGALTLMEALILLRLGRATETPQDDAAATYAGKIDREQARVDWTADAAAVHRRIRAFDARPGAFTTRQRTDVKLFGARMAEGDGAPGTVLDVQGAGMVVACGTGAVRVAEVQPAGRRRLRPVEWARGRGIAVGDRLGG